MTFFANSSSKYGNGTKAPSGSLKDSQLSNQLQLYKSRIAARYRILKPSRIVKDIQEKVWISAKIDGELWFLVKKEGNVALCAYNGRVIENIEITDEAEEKLKDVGDIIIPGELFSAEIDSKNTNEFGGKEKRPRVHSVSKVLADGKLSCQLGFKAFDMMKFKDDVYSKVPYGSKLKTLEKLFNNGKRVTIPPTVKGEGAEDVANYFDEWVMTKKTEGLILRNESEIIHKLKTQVTVDAVIIGFGERANSYPDLGQMIVALMRSNGMYHILGTVGGGFSDDDRRDWYDRLIKMEIESDYKLSNKHGTLCRFVRPEIIVEIKCSEVVAADSKDNPKRRAVLSYQNGKYTAAGQMPLVSMVHPIFQREREDKTLDEANIGLNQIYSIVPFESKDEKPDIKKLKRSEIVQREVYTKTTGFDPEDAKSISEVEEPLLLIKTIGNNRLKHFKEAGITNLDQINEENREKLLALPTSSEFYVELWIEQANNLNQENIRFAGNFTRDSDGKLNKNKIKIFDLDSVEAGLLYVRKYVLIKTNKEKQDERYPPFVLFSTDFSPNRALPVNTSVQVANNKESAGLLIEQWTQKNVKKGWKTV